LKASVAATLLLNLVQNVQRDFTISSVLISLKRSLLIHKPLISIARELTLKRDLAISCYQEARA
jgi:CRISPR/Cas system CSM-associated protein Csm4 (group 5 of RAMP superfamily)